MPALQFNLIALQFYNLLGQDNKQKEFIRIRKQQMIEQQNDFLKNDTLQNQYLVDSDQNFINLSPNDINMPKVLTNTSNQVSPIYDLSQSTRIQQLEKQNQSLILKNKQLIGQLQQFSKKLDQELRKRAPSTQRKQKFLLKPQEKQSIEIQNLYKKLQIYKKEISLLKSKLSDDNDIKLNDIENKVKLYVKQNQELREQIKTMKKVVKQQEKGLSAIGAEGFIKLNAQNQRHKQQLRKMRLQIDQVERKYRTNSAYGPKQTPKNSQKSGSFYRRLKLTEQKGQNGRVQNRRKLLVSSQRLKTQPDHKIKVQIEQNQSQLNLNKDQTANIEKYEVKIRTMKIQKQRQRQIIENLKVQIVQKDKQINYLKQKIDGLRKLQGKTNNPKKSKHHYRNQSRLSQSQIIEQDNLSAINDLPSRETGPYQNSQSIKGEKQRDRSFDQEDYIKIESKNITKSRYPRIEEQGTRRESSYKWNHHQFSSKIKQIKVYSQTQGFIQSISVRYEKGEPYGNSNEHSSKKCHILVCQESQEFIQQIKGGFKSGYLQYLILKTNRKRVVEFCNVELQNQCDNFTFTILNDEYPCALFGENDNEGVLRLGCFIEKLPLSPT